jgi:type II secretory pathway component GspD/PulD (secretin)
MNNQTNNQITKLPFLGDLPFIGAAFRSTTKSKNQRELIIFLTPHIIDEPDRAGLKMDNPSISAQAALDIQDADEHAREISNSLNNFDTK